MKYFLLILISILIFPFISQGTSICTIDNTMDPNGPITVMPAGALVGQQFVACETGSLAFIKLDVKFKTVAGGAIDLYLVNGTGATISAGSPLKTFTGLSDGMQTLNLSGGQFIVQEGERYAFALGGAQVDQITLDMTPVGAPANPNLPDGLFAFAISGGTFSEQMPTDLFFSVGISFTPIPTLSQWGLLILGLLVLNLGSFVIRREELLNAL